MDDRFRDEIGTRLDKALMIYSSRAIVGIVDHDVAHSFGSIAGSTLSSGRDADDVAIARGLVYFLLTAKSAIEGFEALLRTQEVLERLESQQRTRTGILWALPENV